MIDLILVIYIVNISPTEDAFEMLKVPIPVIAFVSI